MLSTACSGCISARVHSFTFLYNKAMSPHFFHDPSLVVNGGLLPGVKVDMNYFCISSFFAVCLFDRLFLWWFFDGTFLLTIHTQAQKSSELVIFRSRFIFHLIIVCRVNESISNAMPTLHITLPDLYLGHGWLNVFLLNWGSKDDWISGLVII